uniref:Uncharacterized protein n=1 Tax=Anguilla anguilla TaxID=7936 RepID=A0A0E9P7H4_ANGAN
MFACHVFVSAPRRVRLPPLFVRLCHSLRIHRM